MKKIIFGIICLSFAALAWSASLARVDRRVDDFMVVMGRSVTLDDKQAQALADILYQGMSEYEDVLESYAGHSDARSRERMQKELDSVNQVMRSEAREILNAPQYETFVKVQNQQK